MRPIEFRAWDNRDKRMLYRNIFDMNWYATPKNTETGSNCVRGIRQQDARNLILEQYTGLKDKKRTEEFPEGQKIFEGDILLITNPSCQLQKMEVRGRVDYRFCAWYVVDLESLVWQKYNVPPPCVNDSMLFATIIDSKGIEVIGNIHDTELEAK